MPECKVIIPDNATASALAVCLRSLAMQLERQGTAPIKRVRIDKVQRMLFVEVDEDEQHT